jgi:hypothetical protein
MQIEEDAPIADAPAESSFRAAQRFDVSSIWRDAHFGESVVDPLTIVSWNAAQISRGRAIPSAKGEQLPFLRFASSAYGRPLAGRG